MHWRRLLIVAAIVIPPIWLLAYGFTRDPRYIHSPLIRRKAPPFMLTLFDELDQALLGIVSAEEGRGEYRSVR